MNITNAKYITNIQGDNSSVRVTIDGQEMFVPINAEGNRHWKAIQEWVAEGNTIAEAD